MIDYITYCLQFFDTVGWAPVKLNDEVLAWWCVVVFLFVEVQMICIWSSRYHCYPASFTLLKSGRIVYLSVVGLPRFSLKKTRQINEYCCRL